MVLISVLAIGSIGSAQDLPTDVGKGANDVGAETVDKDSTRGAEDFANGVAYATTKQLELRPRSTKKVPLSG